MPRITRSKAIQLAEDNNLEDTQQHSPRLIHEQYRRPLEEISINTEDSQIMESMDETEAEIRGLKAAFRTAIGVGGKKNKKKNKKNKAMKIQQTGSIQEAENDNHMEMHSAVEKVSGNLTGEMSMMNQFRAKLTLTPPTAKMKTADAKAQHDLRRPATRCTSKQAAHNIQAGQFHPMFSSICDSLVYGVPGASQLLVNCEREL
jgi:hypothetical protein